MGWVRLRGEAHPIPVGKIVCLGQNYAEHAREMGNPNAPEFFFFLKPASAIVHDGEPILIPPGVGRVDHEVELAVVIGSTARNVPVARAMDHVLGYAPLLDVTARELQAQAKKQGRPWTASKGFDTFAPVGTVVPRADVPDPHALAIELRVNDQIRQRGSTSQMVARIPEAIARVSEVMTLERGDILATGTPAGVGPLHPGDLAVARIERVGTLSNPVRAQPKGT
ncbi:MAG TPA: fumarylacetoacetate hydrolase family protein [Candidatus Thermoplasmatota archaeon]|nr:fumarylacetoacetate hydrolase family protein [Candidatus Thermoplasmatota archaeon]